MLWLKLFTDVRTDRKLQTLSAEQFQVFIFLLCFSAEEDPRGWIGYEDLELLSLEVAGGDVDLLTATLERLTKLYIVEWNRAEQVITIINFDKRQSQGKPSDRPDRVTARVRRCRELKRIIGDVTPCNAPETPLKRQAEAEAEAESLFLSEKAEAEQSAGVREVTSPPPAPPARLPSVINDDGTASALLPPFSAAAELLDEDQLNDLTRSGWTMVEIDRCCVKVRQRMDRPDKPLTRPRDVKVYILPMLPEVRNELRREAVTHKAVPPAPKARDRPAGPRAEPQKAPPEVAYAAIGNARQSTRKYSDERDADRIANEEATRAQGCKQLEELNRSAQAA